MFSARAAGETSVLKLLCCSCPRVGIVASKCPGSPDHVRHLALLEPSGLEGKGWVHMAATEFIPWETVILEAGTPFQKEQINTSPAVVAYPDPAIRADGVPRPRLGWAFQHLPVQEEMVVPPPVSLWEKLS